MDNLIIKQKRPKGEDGYKVFSLRIREELAGQVEDLAAQTGHSRNELICQFVEFALQRCQVEPAEAGAGLEAKKEDGRPA